MSTNAPHQKPIVLVPVRVRQAADRDTLSTIPNSIPLGLYESDHGLARKVARVPPLAYFCIRKLIDYPDQVYGLGSHRIRSQPQVLRALSPSAFGDINAATRCLCKLDPRLWSVIVQVYSDLPRGLQNYHIPLGDRHLPLLQTIPSTPSFALITVLNLAGRVSDETSHALKTLHGLCALDISGTSISHLGIRHFAPAITSEAPDRLHGTRGLRILRLRRCPKITDQVIGAVSTFPLLAVLGSYRLQPFRQTTHTEADLRGTSCDRDLDLGLFRRSSKGQRNLFQYSLQDALQQLRDSDSHNVLFSNSDPFVIHINTEFHPHWPQRPDRREPPSDTLAYERPHRHENSQRTGCPALNMSGEEQELRAWIRSMLGDAANGVRISMIAEIVMERWEYNPEGLGYDDRHSSPPWEQDDSIDSWDEEDSTESSVQFCGYEVNKMLEEMVSEIVREMREEHKRALRFYGLDPRTPKAVVCHCGELRGITTSLVENIPTDRYLMLVRDPPPWDSVYGPDALPLQKIRLVTKPSLSSLPNLNLDRSSSRARRSTREMFDMIAQRKSLPTVTTTPSLAFTPLASANPFRKGSSSGSVRGEPKGLPLGHGDSVRDGNPDSVPDDPTLKRVKLISQIPVPPRPTLPAKSQLRRANRGSGGQGVVPKESAKLKQTTLLGAFGKRA